MTSSEDLSVAELRDQLKRACEELDDEKAQNVATFLHDKGLTKRRRLCMLRESDLTQAGLNDFQAMEVLQAFRSLTGASSC